MWIGNKRARIKSFLEFFFFIYINYSQFVILQLYMGSHTFTKEILETHLEPCQKSMMKYFWRK